jgi:hypothetical protein
MFPYFKPIKLLLKCQNLTVDAFEQINDSFFSLHMPVWSTINQWRTQEFCLGGGSTNSFEDRAERTWILGQ